MKTLRWLALVCSLLIIGVLIAAGPSEAVGPPILTVDGQMVIFTSTTGTCSPSDTAAGYTACYQIKTGSYGAWSVQSDSPGGPARLLIADNNGNGGSLDKCTLTGVTFQPLVPTTPLATLTVTYTNTFDAAPNPATTAPGGYMFALRIGGYIVAGNTNGDNTDIGDRVTLSGSGSFPTPASLGSLDTGDIGGPATPTVSFSSSQTSPFSKNPCNTGSNQCSPTITQTLIFKDFNGDTLHLTNSGDGAGGDCNLTAPNPGGPPSGTPAHPCRAREQKIAQFFSQQDKADAKSAAQAGAVPFTPCETEACLPPPCVGTCGKATPILTTLATPAASCTATSCPTISDTASLVGGSGTLGGNVTFKAWKDDNTCMTTPVFDSGTISVSSAGGGMGTAMASFQSSVADNTTSTYYWEASYSGDTNNNGVSSKCGDTGESSTVTGRVVIF